MTLSSVKAAAIADLKQALSRVFCSASYKLQEGALKKKIRFLLSLESLAQLDCRIYRTSEFTKTGWLQCSLNVEDLDVEL